MSGFDDTIARATRRLRADRELQLEVAHELRTHLEAAADEARRAGQPDAEAQRSAVAQLGDPDALADELWRVNRGRLRWRAIGWWAARVALVPAAAVLAAVLLGGTALPRLAQAWGPDRDPSDLWRDPLVQATLRLRMTDAQELIALGPGRDATTVEHWRAVRDAFPDEPLYQSAYAQALLGDMQWRDGHGDFRGDPVELAVETTRARRLDPGNALYDLMEFRVLYDRLVPELGTDERHRGPRVETPEDEAVAAEARALIHRAAQRPRLETYGQDLVEQVAAQLPLAASYGGYAAQLFAPVEHLPNGGYYSLQGMEEFVAYEARRLADAGRTEEALVLLDDLSALNAALFRSGPSGPWLLPHTAAYSVLTELDCRAYVLDVMGREAEAASATARAEALRQRLRGQELGRTFLGSGDPIWLLSEGPAYSEAVRDPADLGPFRAVEYVTVDRATLGTVVGLLLLGGAGAWLAGGVASTAQRGAVRMWPGWRRVALVVAAGGLAPLTAAWAGAWWVLDDAGLGVERNLSGVVARFAVVAVVAVLLWLEGTEALRRRAAELGLATPAPRPWWRAAGVFVLGAAGLTVFGLSLAWTIAPADIAWYVLDVRDSETGGVLYAVFMTLGAAMTATAGGLELLWIRGQRGGGRALLGALGRGAAIWGSVLLVSLIVIATSADRHDMDALLLATFWVALLGAMAYGLAFLARQRGETPAFAGAVWRSVGPVCLVAAVGLGVVGGGALRVQEARYIREMVAIAPTWLEAQERWTASDELADEIARQMPAEVVGR